MKVTYHYIAWKEEGYWNVHSPALPGVYGWGRTLAAAKKDFLEAAHALFDYLDEIGERPPRESTPSAFGSVTIVRDSDR